MTNQTILICQTAVSRYKAWVDIVVSAADTLGWKDTSLLLVVFCIRKLHMGCISSFQTFTCKTISCTRLLYIQL